MDATVTNNSSTTMAWSALLNVEGLINQVWNAVYTSAGTDTRFSGVNQNNLLQSGQSTDFGFCADRQTPPSAVCIDNIDNDGDGLIDFGADPGCENPDDGDEYNTPPSGGSLDTTVTISSDWNTGYCANIVVVNPGDSTVDWSVTFPVNGAVYDLWSAAYVQNGNVITAQGLSWNNIVQAGASVNFGFCANK